MAKPIPQILDDAIAELKSNPRYSKDRSFGEEVRKLRERLGVTQEAFAERYGLSVSNIRNWEQANRNVQPDSAARLMIDMIKTDPDRIAEIVERVRKARNYRNRKTA